MTKREKALAVKRLDMLASFLDTLPQDRFDFCRWVGLDWKGAPDLSCGTKACAVGWATTIPYFRRLGLRLLKDGFPAFKGLRELEAAARVFGITEDDAAKLFTPSAKLNVNSSPEQVASAIRLFIKELKDV